MFGKQQGDIELKEACDKKQFAEVLRDWLHCIEKRKDLVVKVNGRNCTIPAEAMDKGYFRLEYEVEKGECEFELTLKWC